MIRGLIVFLGAALYVRSDRELKILVLGLACVAYWQALETLNERYRLGLYRVDGTIGNPNSLSICFIA